MSAKVSMLYICPKCQKPMSSSDKPKLCPSCLFKFNQKSESLAQEYAWNKSPMRQLFEITQQETEKILPQSAREIFPNMPAEKLQEMQLNLNQKSTLALKIAQGKMEKFMMETTVPEVEGTVQSVFELMRGCVSSGRMDLIRACQAWASEFEKINEYLKPFVKFGGVSYARKNTEATEGSRDIR